MNTHNNLYKHSSLLLFSKKGETIPNLPQTAVASSPFYNRVLVAVEDAANTLTAQPLTMVESLKKAYHIYEHAKKACEALPHSRGRGIAHQQMMELYKYIIDSRRMLISEEFNTKISVLVNLIDKATRSLEENQKTGKTNAARLYGRAQEIFASLPEEPLLEHKKENIRRHLAELHQRIVHAGEVEEEQCAHQKIHAIEVLLGRAEKVSSEEPEAARKIYGDIITAYRGLNMPPQLVAKKAVLRRRMHALEARLKPEKKQFYAPPEHALSPELVALIAGSHALKQQQGFPALIHALARLETCTLEHLAEARPAFVAAKRIAAALQGDKKRLNPCFAKIRARLEMLAQMEKAGHAKSIGGIHAILAQVQRQALDYNVRYSHDHAFTDKIYEECALIQTLLEEGGDGG